MVTIYISIIVPIVVFTLAYWLVEKRYPLARKFRYLLLIACGLYFISWYVPSPLINGKDTAFMTHFIGGGLFSGYLWLYLRRAANWKPTNWLIGFASLYALVSSLGVLNELAELVATYIGIMGLGLNDTTWDLLANTVGALLFYMIYRTLLFIRFVDEATK